MVLQAFVDESDDGEFFVLAGYLATPEAWEKFSQDWERMLPHAVLSNSDTYQFKMSEMTKTPERLVAASLALEFAPDGNVIGVKTATTRADGLTIVPTHLAECLVSLGFSHLVDALEGEGAGSG